MSLLRIAAIDFLNPAPLMWNFEHAPEAERLAARYSIERMTPALCASQLATGVSDIGLIPVATYASIPGLAIIPGCTIASLDAIRSLLLVVRDPDAPAATDTSEADLVIPINALRKVKRVALDTASRTSAMYTRILFEKYWKTVPAFVPHAPALDAMLIAADAALLIGDPALYALEDRARRERETGERLRYIDLGHAWRMQTGVPWISAFWAAREQSLASAELPAATVAADFLASRDAGLRNIPALTSEWSARLHLPHATVETYLTKNIHYTLDESCLAGLRRFYEDAHSLGLLPAVPKLIFL